MDSITLVTGKKYEAVIKLSFIEAMAVNSIIEDKLREAGFKNVTVSGSGMERNAVGEWSKITQKVKDPALLEKLKNVKQLN